MTQNTSYSGSTYSSSMSDDKHTDKRESDDPNEIRADIDQTRASVGEKIDQLQARLDPSRLKQQATETVQEILNDTATSVTEYVRSHRDEMVTSIADAARRNPLPTALVGLGVGWLILESMAGSKRHDDDSQYQRRSLSSRDMDRGYEGSMGRSRGEFIDDAYFSEQYNTYGPAITPTGSEYRAEYEGRQDYGNGQQHRNPVAKAADAVKDTVSNVTGEIKDRVSDVGQDIKERVEDAGQGIKESMSDMKDRMGDMGGRAGDMAGGMRRQASEFNDEAQFRMQKAGYRMEEWQQRARYEGKRRGEQVVRNLEDNPLIYGAVALAAGAALALLLPSTRVESRAFGEMRDQVMDKGREVMETAKSRAQEVISEVRPELEEKARQVVSDVKEMGKEVARDAVEELRPAVDKAVAKAKEGAKEVAQDVGIDPNKLTSTSSGNTPKGAASLSGSSTVANPTANASTNDALIVNRDTLRGQWTQLKGEVKSKWGQLTDDELTRVEGDMDKLVGSIQTRYGYTRGRAEQEVNDFFKSRKA